MEDSICAAPDVQGFGRPARPNVKQEGRCPPVSTPPTSTAVLIAKCGSTSADGKDNEPTYLRAYGKAAQFLALNARIAAKSSPRVGLAFRKTKTPTTEDTCASISAGAEST